MLKISTFIKLFAALIPAGVLVFLGWVNYKNASICSQTNRAIVLVRNLHDSQQRFKQKMGITANFLSSWT